MRLYLSNISAKVIDTLTDRFSTKVSNSSYPVEMERLFNARKIDGVNTTPKDIFLGINEDFWFWLNTEGCRTNKLIRGILPGMPSEDIQLNYTGNKGDKVLRDGFNAYLLFKEIYERHNGELSQNRSVLDFGCGWGRIIRFFLKDVEPSKLRGCDPVPEMIDLCQQQNKWCQFTKINTKPPAPFQDGTFDLIYAYSVFSHLSEEMHNACLLELQRILAPGGLLIVTTRNRRFIKACADLRKRSDLETMNPGPRSSASAFLDTKACLSDYDAGRYCFHQLVPDGEWSYWGEAAIPKDYVIAQWQQGLTFVDYIDDENRCEQNVIVMRKLV